MDSKELSVGLEWVAELKEVLNPVAIAYLLYGVCSPQEAEEALVREKVCDSNRAKKVVHHAFFTMRYRR